MNSRKWWWAVALLVVLGVWGGVRLKHTPTTPASAPTASRAPDGWIEVSGIDLLTLQEQVLGVGVPVSGTLRAAQSAWVKARVAGELQAFSLREGDSVKAGQIVGRIDPTEYERRLRQALEQAQAAQAQVDIARKQYDNNNALVQQGFISQTALDTSLYSLQAAQATLRAAQAGAEVARKSLDDSVLRAPISGQVSLRSSQNGERLAIDAKVIEIVDLQQLELEATFSPVDAGRVVVGQSARLQVEGIHETIAARVVRINPSVQTGSRNVLAYLQVSPVTGLRQGLFASGLIGTAQMRAVALPITAVRTDQSVPYVQWVQEGTVRHAPVKVGSRARLAHQPDGEEWVQIEGLSAGSTVLAGHLGRLREGLQVRTTGAAGN